MRPPDGSEASVILHVDMDAFYASVALRDRPDLADLPVAVGGAGRGVVLSANYVARAAGIRSAMPMSRARRLCPSLVVLPPDFAAFERSSAAVREIFRQVTDLVEVISLDEAFLDVSGAVRRLGTPWQIAELIRARIHDEQRITCSVGVAPTISVAKLAGRLAKPDGVAVVAPHQVIGFLHPLDVGELWGVGERTRARLVRLGLITVGDVAHTPLPVLQQILGIAAGGHLHRLAWGADRQRVTPRSGPHAPERSTGADHTFAQDVDDAEVIRRELLRLSAKVGRRVRAVELSGRTVTLRVRFADFTTLTRSRTLAEATDRTGEIHRAACGSFEALGLQRARIRLVGVRLEQLVPTRSVHRQLVLGEPERGWSEVEQAMDAATRRFGRAAVRPASLIGADSAQ
ncbi:DNA polymerase IV [Nocardioides limicola]|uniref:DNA polymerase IV n=1 Tax=Nocardioides limicola TaxID=2803368 RepID=UPI00193BDE6A|nr:DNA polymerase IV [Nocardioides sp. DJM-14]